MGVMMKIKSLLVLFPLMCAAANAAPVQGPVYQFEYETAGAMSPRLVTDNGDEYAPLPPIGGDHDEFAELPSSHRIVASSETELVRQLKAVTTRGMASARIYANVPFADVDTVAALANKLRANAETLESLTWYVRLYDANHPKNP